ncbi:MAG TPA: DUF4350 domain-containing protein [Gemmatimonadales bacterium]|nr:DUF4350 domain-containing protein [Gemmatimonadales bacterium]
MRPRTELALAVGIVTILGLIVTAIGTRGARPEDEDLRRSTYLAGPFGARGFAEGAERLGIRVTRHRSRTRQLADAGAADSGTTYVVLDPTADLSALDGLELSGAVAQGGSLLLAGSGTASAVACYGYAPLPVPGRDAIIHGDTVEVWSVLTRLPDSVARRRSLLDDGSDVACGPIAVRAETLLATLEGAPVAMRLMPDSGGTVTLVADGRLFTNRALRETGAGEFTLGLVEGRASRLIVDEYHHGFGTGGGLLAALRSWLVTSPWGWAVIHLAAVSILALFASAVRFGPARHVISRRRRSALEHVRALANALAAARGHDEAVGLLIRGLRRRLARPGERLRGDVREWLAGLAGRLTSPASRDAVATLQSLCRGRADADGVLRAAHAVEDVWQDLKP